MLRTAKQSKTKQNKTNRAKKQNKISHTSTSHKKSFCTQKKEKQNTTTTHYKNYTFAKMKFYQAAIVALLASSVNVVNADEDCTSIVDLACSTEGFSTLCSVLTDVAPALDPDVVSSLKTVFAPTVSLILYHYEPSFVLRFLLLHSFVGRSIDQQMNRRLFLLPHPFETILLRSFFLLI